MLKNIPEDIMEGIELIGKVESQTHDYNFLINCFADGVDYLHAYLRDEPESDHKAFIKNSIKAHARIFLGKLPGLEIDSLELWFNCSLVLTKVREYLKAIFLESPHLQENYNTFRNDPSNASFKEEFLEYLKG